MTGKEVLQPVVDLCRELVRIPSPSGGEGLLVSASVCEEDVTGAALGELLDRSEADLVVVGEPTSLRLGVGQKGRAGVVVETRGKIAHSSRPDLGRNAVTRMMEALSRIRALALPVDPELGSGVCEVIEIRSEPSPSTGTIPNRCTTRLALRLLPGETARSVLARLEGGIAELEGVSVRLDVLKRRCHTGVEIAMEEFVPAWRSRDARLEARLLQALGVPSFAAPYTTNASAAAERGIPAFVLGPGSIEQAHSVDEWIALDELNDACDAYTTLGRTFLAGRVSER